MKILIGLIIVSLVLIAGCAVPTEETTAKEPVQQIVKSEVKQPEIIKKPVAVDKSDEIDLFSVECIKHYEKYTVKAIVRNLDKMQNIIDAYPKVIFRDGGVFAGNVRTLSIDPFGRKTFKYDFMLEQAEPTEVTVYYLSPEEEKLSQKLTVECISDAE